MSIKQKNLKNKCFQIAFKFLFVLNIFQAQAQNTNFIRDIPYNKKGESKLFERLKEATDSLKFDILENGYDSIQIRFWITSPKTYDYKVIIIKNNSTGWDGYYCQVSPELNIEHSKILFYNKECQNLVFGIDWENSFKRIIDLGVFTLPDMSKIKNYPMEFDGGNSVTVEVSNKYIYKLYMYQSPKLNAKEFVEAKSISEILKIISTQFKLKLWE